MVTLKVVGLGRRNSLATRNSQNDTLIRRFYEKLQYKIRLRRIESPRPSQALCGGLRYTLLEGEGSVL